MADGEALRELAGVVSELEENRGQSKVKQDPQGQESSCSCVAVGGVGALMRSKSDLGAYLRRQRSRPPLTSWRGSCTT